MGCRIIVGTEQGSDITKAVLFDSVKGWAFGPTFDSEEEAEAFIGFCQPVDPRSLSPLALENEHVLFGTALRQVREDVDRSDASIDSNDGSSIVVDVGRTVLRGSIYAGSQVRLDSIERIDDGRVLKVESEFMDDGRSPPWEEVWEKAEETITALHKEVLECKPE